MYSYALFGNFRRNFRFKAEAVFFNVNGLDNLPFKRFITGFHIRKLLMRENIGKFCERHIRHSVREITFAPLMQKP